LFKKLDTLSFTEKTLNIGLNILVLPIRADFQDEEKPGCGAC
jgi:hypothetical protein